MTALQLRALLGALISVASPADKAEKAAEELAGYENPFARLEANLTTLKWMLGFILALTAGALGKLLIP